MVHSTPHGVGFYRLIMAVVCLLFWMSSSHVHAWTNTRVREVETKIELLPNGKAEVAMQIIIQVMGGWLSRFEINGLDPDMVMDQESTLAWVSEEGETYLPKVENSGKGEIVLTFPKRRNAPWRGRYSLDLLYTTDFKQRELERVDGDRIRIRWTLPAWRVGLENVGIQLKAPPGTRIAPLPDLEIDAVNQESRDEGGQRILNWRRIHLPRTVSWTIAFDVPKQAFPHLSKKNSKQTIHYQKPRFNTGHWGLWLATVVGLLAMLKRLIVRISCHQLSCQPIPLIPFKSSIVRTTLILAAAITAGLRFDSERNLALILLGFTIVLSIDRGFKRIAHNEKGAWQRVDTFGLGITNWTRIRSWFDIASWMDISTPLGGMLLFAICCAAGFSVLYGDPLKAQVWAFGTLLTVPLFITGTRKHLPLSIEASQELLAHFLSKLEEDKQIIESTSFELVTYKSTLGKPLESRIRMKPKRSIKGLHRFDLVIADTQDRGINIPQIALLSVVSANSEADIKIKSILSGKSGTAIIRNNLVNYTIHMPEMAKMLRHLLTCLNREDFGAPSIQVSKNARPDRPPQHRLDPFQSL